MCKRVAFICASVLVLLAASSAAGGVRADLSGDSIVDFATTMDMPLMRIGNPGNEERTGYGDVDYVYNIGKFEVTAGQYTEFLNAVGAEDGYGLYSTNMDYDATPHAKGCNIKRSGTPGSYTYSVAADWADRPANYVSWINAVRFVNWLTNGMPTGAPGLTTTEDGSYHIYGVDPFHYWTVTRKTPAEGGRYYIPSEDEWYKAAYHKNDGPTDHYFDYPTGTDVLPGNLAVDPDPRNNATVSDSGYTIGVPYYRTEGGEHENSASPYGVFDMCGNVWEWTETSNGTQNALRGGYFGASASFGHKSERVFHSAVVGNSYDGFRVVEVPEPATLGVLAVGGAALLRRKRR